jgi:adenylate cyclase
VELSLLFVDVRGSTSLAERMSSVEFSRLMNRFYVVATDVLVKTDAFIDKLVGDEVIGIYLPIFTGSSHARLAVQAAQELLRATGHGERGEPWLPIGVGVHTGLAFFGTVSGAEGIFSDFTALGDNVNVAARLGAAAAPGEALISEVACSAAELDVAHLERRDLELKGKTGAVSVRVLRAPAAK